jgi:protein dithiol oxidoreductase (disulfide-forming)
MNMKEHTVVAVAVLILGVAGNLAQETHGATQWVEGTHYFRILPAQPTTVDEGRVEVAEAFSYGCPACNQFLPIMAELEASLSSDAELAYVPASFNSAEQWPLFQQAYYAAKALGVDEQTHLAMFKAVWTTGELAVVDPRTRRLKRPAPTIENVAEFYAANADVTEEQFLAAAKSFSVALDMKRADDWIAKCGVDRTPSFIVNGKYRLHAQSAGGIEELIELVNWLVAQESSASATGSTN